MRALFVGLLATALMVLANADPGMAFQAPKETAKQKAEAATLAPLVIQNAKLPCTMTEVRNEQSTAKQVVMELACQEGVGYIVVSAKDGSGAQAQECIPNPASPLPVKCVLPANLEPAKGLQPYLTRAGSDCVADKAIVLGATPTAAFYEVGCTNGLGQMLRLDLPRSATSKATASSCLAISSVMKSATCSLTTEEANLAAVTALAAKAQTPCEVAKRRYVGAGDGGSQFFEYACASGAGFMIQANAKGEYQRTIGCAQASGIAGGCTLTDAKAAVANQTVTYTTLVKAAGYNCDVNKFMTFPAKEGSTAETVEFACANRPDGAIAVIENAKAEILNCAVSLPNGYSCGYTKPEASFPILTKNLQAVGKESCSVSGVRAVGANSKNAYLEVTCADGLQGYIIAYPLGSARPTEAVVCSQAAHLGGCSMAGNKKS